MRQKQLLVTAIYLGGCFAANRAAAQTRLNIQSQSRNVDFSSADFTKPFKTGTALPMVCRAGEAFLETESSGGASLHLCGSNGAWVTAGGAVSVGSGAPPSTCSAGSGYLQSDSAAGIYQLYWCTSINQWDMASLRSGLLQQRPGNCARGQAYLASDTGAFSYCGAAGWSDIAVPLSAIASPTGNVSVDLKGYSTTLTASGNTGAGSAFQISDTAGNPGTGRLARFSTAAGSAATPWQADANGLGWQVGPAGELKSIGSADSGSITLSGALSGSCTLTVPNTGGAIVPSTAAECDIGSGALPVANLYLAGASAAAASNHFKLTGAATGERTWTLQDTSDVVVGRDTADVLTHKTFDTAASGNLLRINGTAINAVKGNSATVLLAGVIAGQGAALCADSQGNATTTNCVAGSVSGPGVSVTGNIPTWGGTAGTVLTGGLQTVTSIGSPGSNTAIPTEAAVRSAIGSAGGGTMTTVGTGCGLSGGPITTSGIISATMPTIAKSADYTASTGDCGSVLSMTGSHSLTMPQAGSVGFGSGWHVRLQNAGSGSVAVGAAAGAFYGSGYSGSSLTLAAGQGVLLASDGANWNVVDSAGSGSAAYTAGNGVRISGGVISASSICTLAPVSDARTTSGVFATTCTIPANTLAAGSTIEFEASGTITGGGGDRWGWAVKLGGATVITAPMGVYQTPSGWAWSIRGRAVIISAGSSGSVIASADQNQGNDNSASAINPGAIFSSQGSTVTIDSTLSQALAIVYSPAGSTNTAKLSVLRVRVIN